jgi:CBS domain-containing protein
MRVRDLMETEPVVIHPDDAAGAAAALMFEHQVQALPVVDGEGRLVGMVRDLDVLHLLLPGYLENLADLGFLPPDLEPGACSAGDACKLSVMQTIEGQESYSLDENEPILEAVHVMVGHGLGMLPVVREGRLVGTLSARRLLRDLIQSADEAGAGS